MDIKTNMFELSEKDFKKYRFFLINIIDLLEELSNTNRCRNTDYGRHSPIFRGILNDVRKYKHIYFKISIILYYRQDVYRNWFQIKKDNLYFIGLLTGKNPCLSPIDFHGILKHHSEIIELLRINVKKFEKIFEQINIGTDDSLHPKNVYIPQVYKCQHCNIIFDKIEVDYHKDLCEECHKKYFMDGGKDLLK